MLVFGIERHSNVSTIVERVKYGAKANKGLKNLYKLRTGISDHNRL